MLKEAIILAGGFGTRLKTVVNDVPKPMADINGIPFLHYIFAYLKKQGIQSVVLSVGYKHEVIRNYFGASYLGIEVNYAIEDTALGTGGAIKLALKQIKSERCFVINGDTYFDVNLSELVKFEAPCIIASKELEKFDRYGTLQVNSNHTIIGFNEKEYCEKGLINGGIYCIHKSIFSGISKEVFSFETEILEPLGNTGTLKTISSDGYFRDIGIPKDYHQFEQDVLTGGIFKHNGKLSVDKSWTLFLDRDGVINERLVDDYVKQLNELAIIKGVPEAIKTFTAYFGRIVVVTNQQGIGKGLMTDDDLEIIHGFIADVIKSAGGKIDAFYFAPQLKAENSIDRKPGIGMGLKAKSAFPEIDFSKSLMVGDSESDIEFGMKLGMKTVMLKNGRNISTKADYIFENLYQVSTKLISHDD